MAERLYNLGLGLGIVSSKSDLVIRAGSHMGKTTKLFQILANMSQLNPSFDCEVFAPEGVPDRQRKILEATTGVNKGKVKLSTTVEYASMAEFLNGFTTIPDVVFMDQCQILKFADGSSFVDLIGYLRSYMPDTLFVYTEQASLNRKEMPISARMQIFKITRQLLQTVYPEV